MRIEDKLTQTLNDAVRDEPLPKGVWEKFERRARRSQRIRVATTATVAAAAVLAGVLVVPKVVRDRSVPAASAGKFDLSSGPIAGWKTYRFPAGDFTFQYPSDWVMKADGENGFLHPPGLSGTVESDFAFVVNFFMSGQPLDEANGRSNIPGLPEGTISKGGSLNGHRYYANIHGTMIQYSIAWTKDRTIIMTLQSYGKGSFASDVEAFKHHFPTGERIVSTLHECGCIDPAAAGWVKYQSPSKHFSMMHPKDWKVVGFEGGEEFDAPGQPSLAMGGPTFAVEVQEQVGQYDAVMTRDKEAAETMRGTIDGRPYVRYLYHDGQERRYLYRIDWTGISTCATEARCAYTDGKSMLQVSVLGSTEVLWQRFGAIAEDMVHSIEVSG